MSDQKLSARPKRLWLTLKQNYRLLILPAILLVVAVATCIFAVEYATDSMIETQKRLMERAARGGAEELVLQLNVLTGALNTLAVFIRTGPDWLAVCKDFPFMSAEVDRQIRSNSKQDLRGILIMPFGISRLAYADGKGVVEVSHVDLLAPENQYLGNFREALQQRVISYVGPLNISESTPDVVLARYPVFISDVSEDETWNIPSNLTVPIHCPPGLCYNPETSEKFWGFVAAYFNAMEFFNEEAIRLRGISEFAFRLVNRHPFASGSDAPARILAEQGSVLAEGSAQSRIDVPGVDWDLEVFNPAIDEAKATEKGLIALIVVASVILSCLLLLLLTSNKEYVQLLREQVATHGALEKANDHLTHAKRVLEAEKQQRETLVERQLKLISCFDARDRKSSGRATLGRIAEARQQISSTTPQHDHGEDNVQLLELLGNGTFGKVHRGLWRGTVVAIKIMLLPANMSGAEKREKMVVWEAAISSSLTHPNIVQTYSYSIKPIQGSKEQQQANSQGDLQSLGSAIQICGATCSPLPSGEFDGTKHTSPDCPAFLCAKEEQPTSVHSFEVQLVLEYCDKGCLRDALDQGVFMGPTGLNYPAILDSAEDIARAMLHLHCNNVLHMDLKARNVMLASSGTEGRGVCCKIADFGLAVRMGSMETHMSEVFQGTATHMAPEMLLEARVSKAADVYAFGITLWELFTGGEPYRGVPKALLGHKVAREQKRPSFPPVMPEGYKALLRKCWSHKPENRPTFAQVLQELQGLRHPLWEPTPPLQPIQVSSPNSTKHTRTHARQQDRQDSRQVLPNQPSKSGHRKQLFPEQHEAGHQQAGLEDPQPKHVPVQQQDQQDQQDPPEQNQQDRHEQLGHQGQQVQQDVPKKRDQLDQRTLPDQQHQQGLGPQGQPRMQEPCPESRAADPEAHPYPRLPSLMLGLPPH